MVRTNLGQRSSSSSPPPTVSHSSRSSSSRRVTLRHLRQELRRVRRLTRIQERTTDIQHLPLLESAALRTQSIADTMGHLLYTQRVMMHLATPPPRFPTREQLYSDRLMERRQRYQHRSLHMTEEELRALMLEQVQRRWIVEQELIATRETFHRHLARRQRELVDLLLPESPERTRLHESLELNSRELLPLELPGAAPSPPSDDSQESVTSEQRDLALFPSSHPRLRSLATSDEEEPDLFPTEIKREERP